MQQNLLNGSETAVPRARLVGKFSPAKGFSVRRLVSMTSLPLVAVIAVLLAATGYFTELFVFAAIGIGVTFFTYRMFALLDATTSSTGNVPSSVIAKITAVATSGVTLFTALLAGNVLNSSILWMFAVTAALFVLMSETFLSVPARVRHDDADRQVGRGDTTE